MVRQHRINFKEFGEMSYVTQTIKTNHSHQDNYTCIL
jgi:hypothetical protein